MGEGEGSRHDLVGIGEADEGARAEVAPRPISLSVYLAGGALALEFTKWHSVAVSGLSALGLKSINPLRHPLDENLVSKCLADIEKADAVLVCAARPAWSTGMEILHATKLGKPVVAFGAAEPYSPWLMSYCTDIRATLTEAIEVLSVIRQILTDAGAPCEACGDRAQLKKALCSDGGSMSLCPICFEVADVDEAEN